MIDEIPRPSILISANTTWNLVNFRSGLIRALIDNGFVVIAAAPPDVYVERLIALGVQYRPLPMDNKGTHPGRDLLLLLRCMVLLFKERPNILLGYTIKPNIYGSLAARWFRVPVINNISGLGSVFIRNTWVTYLVRELYRFSLGSSARVFFQNGDDLDLFVKLGLVDRDVTAKLPGSGVNLMRFLPSMLQEDNFDRPFRFLLVARLLWDKGVGEFVDAARILRQLHSNVEFCLVGFLDVENPAAISKGQVSEWESEGVIRYLGATDDIRTELARADCVVLPSYREGTPRSLLEAAAMGIPLITTDAVGCREVVDDGINGYLCRVRDSSDLAHKMELILGLAPTEREAMGLQGREKVEREFDEQILIKKYLEIIEDVLFRQKR